MELVYSTGCTGHTLEINKKDWADMPIEEVKEHINKMLPKVNNRYVLQNILIYIAQFEGVCKILDTCEICGDNTDEYTFNY